MDQIVFENPVYSKIYAEFERMVHQEAGYHPNELVNHENEEIRKTAADVLTTRHQLAPWNERGVAVKEEIDRLKHAVMSAVYSIKIKQVHKLLEKNREAIREAEQNNEDFDHLLQEQMVLDRIKIALSEYLSIVVLK